MSQDIFSQAELERAKAEAKCHCSTAMYEAGENKRLQGILEGMEAENALLRKALKDYDQMKSDHEALALKYKDADQMEERLAAKLDAVNKKYNDLKLEHIQLLTELGQESRIKIPVPDVKPCLGGECVDCSNNQSV